MTEQRVINQDILVAALIKLNEAERDMVAIQVIDDESGMWCNWRDAEDGEDSLSLGAVLSHVRGHLVRLLRPREEAEKT